MGKSPSDKCPLRLSCHWAICPFPPLRENSCYTPHRGHRQLIFFIRKIFVHRIGLNLVLAKKNVLKWRECKSYDFFSFFVTQCHSNLYKMGKNVLKSTFLVLSVKRRAISNRINLNIGCRWYTTRATDLWKGPIFQFWPYFLGRKNAKKNFFSPFFIFMYKNTLLTKISFI